MSSCNSIVRAFASLGHDLDYVELPTKSIGKQIFQKIGYNEPITTGNLKNSCLPPKWQLLIAKIIHCLGGKTVGYNQITTKYAMILHCLANGVKIDFAKLVWDYVELPTKSIGKQFFQKIGYNEPITTGNLKNSCLSPKWQLLIAKIIQCLGGKTVGYNQITTKYAMILHCLANVVKIDFAKLIWGTNPSVFINKTKFVGDGLETAYTKTETRKKPKTEHWFGYDTDVDAPFSSSNEEIRMEDLTELVQKTADIWMWNLLLMSNRFKFLAKIRLLWKLKLKILQFQISKDHSDP
nr:hypothetical protein [Tanacetum cinerariifolium]